MKSFFSLLAQAPARIGIAGAANLTLREALAKAPARIGPAGTTNLMLREATKKALDLRGPLPKLARVRETEVA